jgi:hypothetical protein
LAAAFETGSVVLSGRGGDVQLVWTKEKRTWSLPPGAYRLRTSRVEREKDGEHWFLSSCGPPNKPFALEAKEHRLDPGDTVHFQGMFRGWKQDRLVLGFAIRGADGRGLSIYRQDRRVPVTFEVLDKSGDVLEQGRMNYG